MVQFLPVVRIRFHLTPWRKRDLMAKILTVYLSHHGLGHGARSCEVLRQLPDSIEVEIHTRISPEFFETELPGKRLTLIQDSWDVGLIQKDNRTIDWSATREALEYQQITESQRIHKESQRLARLQPQLVYSDMPTAPLLAAQMAGIPTCLLANFTWPQIYSRFPQDQAPTPHLLQSLQNQITAADHLLLPGLALDIPHPNPHQLGLITRTGQPVRNALLHHLQLPPHTRLVLVYLGAWGDRLQPHATVQLATIPHLAFVAFHPLPDPIIQLDPDHWNFHDVLASCDALVAKPGYGMVAAALHHGIPLIHHPREDFAEYPVLRDALAQLLHPPPLAQHTLETGNWKSTLETVFQLPKPAPQPAPGAKAAAQFIGQFFTA